MRNINPESLKGKDRINKMRDLMGKMSLNENKKPSTVELTKLGPDNKVYGIVKENHQYFIKTSNKTKDVLLEDFQYIGGLSNKQQYAYESYSKALKKLNLKMISLNEEYGGSKVNVFENDNLFVEKASLNESEDNDFIEEDIVEGELKVGKVYQDGPKELDGNSIGDFEDSTIEPDDAPNDNSVGTVKSGPENATPKKTIKEGKKRLSILETLEKYDDVVDSILSKKKTLDEVKYKLKVDDPSPEPDVNFDSEEGSIDSNPPAEPQPEMEPEPADDKPFDDEPFDAGVEADEDRDPKKYIQQLSGKLGQSLRKFSQDVGVDLELEKFAINSVISATHTSQMDQEDIQDIINKIETSGNDVEVSDSDDMDDEFEDEFNNPIATGTNPTAAPAAEGTPMGESFETLDKENKQVFKNAKLGVDSNIIEGEDEYLSIQDLERVKRDIQNNYKGHTIDEEDGNDSSNLDIKDKKDTFVDNRIKQMMDDYLKTKDGFETPTKPVTKPITKPTPHKVPRRSKPYRVRPNVNPVPKAKV